MSSRGHSLKDIKGEAVDVFSAIDYLKSNRWIYKRMHFDSLQDAPSVRWKFDKKHLARFQELVDEAKIMREGYADWKAREKRWYGTPNPDSESESKDSQEQTSKKKTTKTSDKQDSTRTSSGKAS